MKFHFVYPNAPQFSSCQRRYIALGNQMKQRTRLGSSVLDGNSFLTNSHENDELCSSADILVLHIGVIPGAMRHIQHWKARDKLVLVDVSVPLIRSEQTDSWTINHTQAGTVTGHESEVIQIGADELLWTFKLVDGIFTNSRLIMDDWKGITETQFIPDYLDLDRYLIHPYESHPGIQLGVKVASGGITKMTETGLLPALETLCNQKPEISLIVSGVSPLMSHQFHMPPAQKILLSNHDLESWMKFLPSLDLCALPRLGPFDERTGRTDLLELLSMNIPWVMSDIKLQNELRQYGWFVVNQQAAWERILFDLADHLDVHRKDTMEGFLYALGQDMEELLDRLVSFSLQIHSKLFSGVS